MTEHGGIGHMVGVDLGEHERGKARARHERGQAGDELVEGQPDGLVADVVKKVDEGLLPKLSQLPGFHGYTFIDAGDGVMTSVGFFDTAAQADESTRVAAGWLCEQQLETAVPNAPMVTSGEAVVHMTPELVKA